METDHKSLCNLSVHVIKWQNPWEGCWLGLAWEAEHGAAEPKALGVVAAKKQQIRVSWPLLVAFARYYRKRLAQESSSWFEAETIEIEKRFIFRVGKANRVWICNCKRLRLRNTSGCREAQVKDVTLSLNYNSLEAVMIVGRKRQEEGEK